jgi:hypothetical protein
VSLPEVAFHLDDYRYLWVTPRAGGEPVRLYLGDKPGALLTRLEEAGLELPTADADPTGCRAGVAFSLRSIRYFLTLPLTTTLGRWEFRSIVSPPGVELPPVLEVFSEEPFAPIGPCLLYVDPTRSHVSQVVYVIRRGRQGTPLKLSLSEYEAVGGIWIARNRCHTRMEKEPAPKPERDPFGFAVEEEEKEEPSCVLREEVANVVFLPREHMVESYPRPEDEASDESEIAGKAESPPPGEPGRAEGGGDGR